MAMVAAAVVLYVAAFGFPDAAVLGALMVGGFVIVAVSPIYLRFLRPSRGQPVEEGLAQPTVKVLERARRDALVAELAPLLAQQGPPTALTPYVFGASRSSLPAAAKRLADEASIDFVNWNDLVKRQLSRTDQLAVVMDASHATKTEIQHVLDSEDLARMVGGASVVRVVVLTGPANRALGKVTLRPGAAATSLRVETVTLDALDEALVR